MVNFTAPASAGNTATSFPSVSFVVSLVSGPVGVGSSSGPDGFLLKGW